MSNVDAHRLLRDVDLGLRRAFGHRPEFVGVDLFKKRPFLRGGHIHNVLARLLLRCAPLCGDWGVGEGGHLLFGNAKQAGYFGVGIALVDEDLRGDGGGLVHSEIIPDPKLPARQ